MTTTSTPYTLVSLSGNVGSGKDWLAQHYFRHQGYAQLSFAWLLKWVAVAQGRCTWAEAFETKPHDVRTMLQHMGTDEWRATYGEDVWVRGLDAVARTWALCNGVTKFVIADARFENEVAAVRALGGTTVRVVAPTRVANNGLTPEQRQHRSEVEMARMPDTAFDLVVHNDPGDYPLIALERRFGLLQLPLAGIR